MKITNSILLTGAITSTLTYISVSNRPLCLSKKNINDRYIATLAQCVNLDFDRDKCEIFASDVLRGLEHMNLKNGCK
jgi:hypothetical protein